MEGQVEKAKMETLQELVGVQDRFDDIRTPVNTFQVSGWCMMCFMCMGTIERIGDTSNV